MDYSVGSLADLITGKNTPNKPKVMQKPFTPAKHDEDEVKESKAGKKQKGVKMCSESKISQNKPIIEKTTGKKKKRKISSSEAIDDVAENNELNSVEEKTIGKKKKKNATESINNEGNSVMEKATGKKKKKINASSTLGNDVSENNEDIPSNDENINITTKIGSKRKSDEHDEPKKSPKKAKLSKSEKNAAKRVLFKQRELTKENEEENARTIYVGNIPISSTLDETKKKLKKHFRKYGVMASVRFRGIPVADPKTPKKVAAIKSEFNSKRKTVIGYIKFVNPEDAQKAKAENGQIFEEHHLRVHLLSEKETPDETKAIFVGNLSFDAEEDDLWKLFEPCGAIHNIRIIRDPRTGMGKGFAYVNFVSSDSVQLALELEKPEIKKRELRITLCNLNLAKKNKKKNKAAKIHSPGKPKFRFRRHRNKDGKKEGDGSKSKDFNKPFQGSKFSDKNKKKKVNKGELQKKKLVKKIAPKSV